MALKSVTVSGSVIKQVKCEKCQCDYAYEMFGQNTCTADSMLRYGGAMGGLIGVGIAAAVSAAVGGGSEFKLRVQAQANLDRSLARRFEIVPCPACGWYQARMVKESRARYRKPLLALGGVLLTIAAAGGVILFTMDNSPTTRDSVSPIAFAIAAAVGFTGLAAVLWRRSLQQAYDINKGYPSPRPPRPGSPLAFDINKLPKVSTASAIPKAAPGPPPQPATATQWYYVTGDRQEGPIAWNDLKNLVAAGNVGPQDLVFAVGTPDWVEAGSVPGLLQRRG